MIRTLLLSCLSLALLALPATSQAEQYDLVIYGGTSAGIAAAVQAKRMDKSVIVVAPEEHLGGLTSGGLGWTDSGRKEAVGGIAREYYQRLKKYYDQPQAWRQQKPEEYRLYRKEDDAMWVFEPHMAERVFEDLVKEYEITVDRNEWLDREQGVETKDGKIVSLKTLSGKKYEGKMFMDATYEGDLMAAAGVEFTTGREPNSKYNETLNGIQKKRAVSHQFDYPVDPYVKKGDPSSGLLARISTEDPGEEGEGDHRIQAYCFRVCLTTADENRVPFAKPEGYDASQYALLARYLEGGWDGVFRKFDPAPNRKTDTNNHGAFSTDNIGMNYDYPEASYERRKEIIAEHELYQRGLFYFLANDPSVRKDVRERMSKWGLAKDEFVDNDNWPHQIYVREARRMVGPVVMTERLLRGLEETPMSVGLGSYNMDSHNVQRYVNEQGHVRNEGDIQISPGGPYPISYGSIVPKKEDCTNLLVPVAVSASHIAYGSIRMEPVFMILGQSAATAAAMAIDEEIAVQDVEYSKLESRLLADKQVLDLPRTNRQAKGLDPKSIKGTVVALVDAKKTGTWLMSNSVGGFVGSGYVHDENSGQGQKSIAFPAKLPAGKYEVRLSYPPNPNRATNVPVVIKSGNKVVHETTIDQKKTPNVDKIFISLGKFDLEGEVSVTLSNAGANGYVVANAVVFVPVED
ncbi:MAG: FAD-dependent oxidoreductase [Pirellulaceae bacterium]